MSAIRAVLLISLFLFTKMAVAQVPVTNSCPADAPVTLHVEPVNPGAELATVTITNKGPKSMSAVLLRWKITDSDGNVLPEVSTVDAAVSGELIPPGHSVSTEGSVNVNEGKSLAAVDVTCVTVLFTGKEFWGDGKIPEVTRLLGIRAGIRSERTRLLNVYEKDGINKLLQELKRPVVK